MKKPIGNNKFFIYDIPRSLESIETLNEFLEIDLDTGMLAEIFFIRGSYRNIAFNMKENCYKFTGRPTAEIYHTVISYDNLFKYFDSVEYTKNGNKCKPLDEIIREEKQKIKDFDPVKEFNKIPKNQTNQKLNKVKNPNSKHYELWNDFEAIDFIKQVLTKEEYIGALKFNILKYRLRLNKKQGEDVAKELQKIKDYESELKDLENKNE